MEVRRPGDSIELVRPFYDALQEQFKPIFETAKRNGEDNGDDHYLTFHSRRQ